MRTKPEKTAKLLKEVRLAKSVSQLDLCKAMGFEKRHGQHIHNWERGKAQIPPKRVAQVCHLLGIPKDVLIDTMVEDYRQGLLVEFKENDDKLDKSYHPFNRGL